MINFLAAVLPATGNYVLNVATSKADGAKWHKNYNAETVQDVENLAAKLDLNQAQTVYYGLAAYENNVEADGKVRRTQEKAARFKTLAFDVDPKDNKQNMVYATQQDMAMAALSSCAKIGLPDPVFVSSGHGLHCYYPLDAEITKDTWVILSTMLRDALMATGMVLDYSKVCDPSMVLRPVGTHNKKNGGSVEVKLLSPMTLFSAYDLAAVLKAYVKPAPKAVSKSATRSPMLAAILDTEFPPADSALVEQRCLQLEAVAKSGGQVGYNLWRLAIGVAKHCTDGVEVAKRWSDQHPTYSEAETIAKYDSWKTPPATCKAFDNENPKVCPGCSHYGRITSPIQLGMPEVSAPLVVPSGKSPTPPKGYTFHNDKVFRVVDGESMFVSDYIIFPSTRYKDETTGKSMCLAECQLPKEGWRTYELPMDVLSTSSDFQVWLINHQMFVYTKALVDEMRRYMLTYLQELQKEEESDTMSSAFGWTDDTCTEFVLGTRLISKGETKELRLSNAASDFTSTLLPRGDRDKWVKASGMYNETGMDIFGLVFLMSLGSPLMVGSGLKSVLVNMFSTNSGTGKTSTGLFALSAYGNPHKLMLTVQDTDNSVFKSMGVYGNLPVYVDEITKIDKDKAGRLSKIVYFITQGREKRRLNKDGGFQESVEWESITTASSNDNLYALLGSQMTFDGESMRILQFNVPDTPLFNQKAGSTLGYDLSMFLQKNYGLVGEEFIRGIIMSGGPAAIYDKARTDFAKKFDFAFAGKERFWQAAMVVAYATGNITNALGLTNMNVDACIRAGLEQIKVLRSELMDEKLDCFDTLGLYVSENASRTIVHRKNVQLKNDGRIMEPCPHEASIRVEALCDNNTSFLSGKLFLNRVTFNDWCQERGVDRRGLLTQLSNQGVVIHKDKRVSIMRGSGKPLPAVRVYEIELQHPRFLTIMQQNDIGTAPVAPFTLVKGEGDAANAS